MKLNAIFSRKEPKVETIPCFIENIMHMSGKEFQFFKTHLLNDYDFIEKNIDRMFQDKDGIRHCILALDVEGGDGILIDSSGYSYARYASFLPCIKPYLEQQVFRFADAIRTKAMCDGVRAFDLQAEAKQFGISVREDNGVGKMLVETLSQLSEICSYSFEDGNLHLDVHQNMDFDTDCRKIMEACKNNPWLSNGAAYPLEDYPFTFELITAVESLKTVMDHGNTAIRTCYLYEDLAFVQQVNGGDEWLTLRKERVFIKILKVFLSGLFYGSMVMKAFTAALKSCSRIASHHRIRHRIQRKRTAHSR